MGLAEMNSTLIEVPVERLAAAVRRPGGHHVGRDLALRSRGDGDVEESRSRDVDLGDAVGGGQRVGQGLRQLAWRHPRLLGQLERDVGRVVAVLLVARPLHDHLGRHPVGQAQVSRLDLCGEGGDDGIGELGGRHRSSLTADAFSPDGVRTSYEVVHAMTVRATSSHDVARDVIRSGRRAPVRMTCRDVIRSGCQATSSYDVWRWGNLATAPRAPVAQGIEHRPPEAGAKVRILPGAQPPTEHRAPLNAGAKVRILPGAPPGGLQARAPASVNLRQGRDRRQAPRSAERGSAGSNPSRGAAPARHDPDRPSHTPRRPPLVGRLPCGSRAGGSSLVAYYP